MSQRTIRALVSGKVQRVYYRASLQREALRLGLLGCVRNLPDGRVEFLARGPNDAVEELLRWSKGGPPMAEVSGVELIDIGDEPEWQEFVILR